jgi:hypothetical protein
MKKNTTNRSLGLELEESLEQEQIEQKFELTLLRQRSTAKNSLLKEL